MFNASPETRNLSDVRSVVTSRDQSRTNLNIEQHKYEREPEAKRTVFIIVPHVNRRTCNKHLLEKYRFRSRFKLSNGIPISFRRHYVR